MTRVRLSEFCKIIRKERETFRAVEARGQSPLRDKDPTEKQRTFDGADGLEWIVFEMLEKSLIPQAGAASFVRTQRLTITRFLDAIEANRPAPQTFVAACYIATEDSKRGVNFKEAYIADTGSADEILRSFEADLSNAGRVINIPDDNRTERYLGVTHITTVSIPEAYRLLKLRAETAGYVVDGRRILKLDTTTETEGDEA